MITGTIASRLRRELADALPYPVVGYPVGLTRVATPTVAVWTEAMTKVDTFGPPRLQVTLAAHVMVSAEDPNLADDQLETALMALLGALQPLTWVAWDQVERAVLEQPVVHTFKVTVTAMTEPIDTPPDTP